MQALFWSALLFVGYTYVGYPLAVWLLAKLRAPEPGVAAGLADWPAVTIVIAVHNEEARVRGKIANLRELDYPADRVRWIFVSDGSTDATNDLLRTQPGVHLIEYAQRRGKPHALNAALREVTTPIVVFADVRQHIDRAALRMLVARLMQPGIGAVSGELVHFEPGTRSALTSIGLMPLMPPWMNVLSPQLTTCRPPRNSSSCPLRSQRP